MIAFLLYLLLQVSPPVGISPIVSGFKNLRRNTLLHADAIRVKPLYFRYVKTHGETHDRIVVDPLHHPDSVLQGLACYGILEACVPRTMLGNPPVLLPHLIHTIIRYARYRPNIIEVFLESLSIASACNKVLRRKFLKPDTIVLITAVGYTCNNMYSRKAIMWLLHMEKNDGVAIKHARN